MICVFCPWMGECGIIGFVYGLCLCTDWWEILFVLSSSRIQVVPWHRDNKWKYNSSLSWFPYIDRPQMTSQAMVLSENAAAMIRTNLRLIICCLVTQNFLGQLDPFILSLWMNGKQYGDDCVHMIKRSIMITMIWPTKWLSRAANLSIFK